MQVALVLLTLSAVCGARAEMVNGEDLIDPTAPLLLQASPTSSLLDIFVSSDNYEVTSILIRPSLRIAVINGKRARIGDIVGNAEVVNIENDSVLIRINGEESELRLRDGSVKTQIAGSVPDDGQQ